MTYIEIGGQKRPVRYSFNALIEFKELTGLDWTDGDDKPNIKNLEQIRALAFVGLKGGCRAEKKEVDFTQEDVGDWLAMDNISLILKSFAEDNSAGTESESQEVGAEKKYAGVTSGV